MIDADSQGRANEGRLGRCAPPQYFQICKKFGQKSAILQESWPEFFSNNSWSIGHHLPNRRYLGTSLLIGWEEYFCEVRGTVFHRKRHDLVLRVWAAEIIQRP